MTETFTIKSAYQPAGDQPEAIKQLVQGVKEGKRHQTLLGATGTGKTFTISNVIKEVNKPTLVMAHNKTLANYIVSLKNFSRTMRLNISSATMTISSRKRMYRKLILTLKRIQVLMKKSINCATRQRLLCLNGKMSLLSHPYRVFTVSVIRKNIVKWSFPFVQGWKSSAISYCGN